MGDNLRRRSISPLPLHSYLTFLAYHDFSPPYVAPNSGSLVQHMATYDPCQHSIATPPSQDYPFVSNSPTLPSIGGSPHPEFLYQPGGLCVVWGKTLL